MSIERQLEAKVIAKLQTALADYDSVVVEGTWQETNTGVVKGEELTGGTQVRVSVAVGAPSYDQYLTPTSEMPVAIAMSVRRELAPTAAELDAVYAVLQGVLVAWQLDDSGSGAEVVQSELTSTNFRADGVRLDPGDPPSFVSAANVWRVVRSLTVRGVIIQ